MTKRTGLNQRHIAINRAIGPRCWAGALIALVTLLSPSNASAYEDQLTLGVALGYGLVAVPDVELPANAATLGVSASIGLGDTWTLRGHATYGLHPGEDVLHVILAGAELLYVVDILEWVPFIGVGVDSVTTVFTGGVGGDFGAHVVAGIDWLPARDWLVGLDLRAFFLPFSIASVGVDPVYISAQVRMSLLFDL